MRREPRVARIMTEKPQRLDQFLKKPFLVPVELTSEFSG